MPEHVQIRKDLPSGTIIIDRPALRNALSPQTIRELQTAFEDLHGERKVRGVILTGAGECFSAGTDLKHLAEQFELPDPEHLWEEEIPEILTLIETMLRFPKPIVAAVSGPVAGMGLALMLAADFVVAAEQSRFSVPEVKLGLLPGFAAPLLTRRSGVSHAQRLILTGQAIDADVALRLQIIDELVKADQVWARAHQWAGELAQGAPSSHQLARQLINETISEDLFTQLSIGAANTAAARSTEAARRGVQAFLQKKGSVDWNE